MTDKPFSAHDLDIDNSGSPISRMLRGKTSRPPTEEEIVDRTRRDTYKNILAGLGVDYEEDASATTLLLQVNAEVERAVELRDAASAVVEALTSPFCTPHRHCRHQDCRSVALWWSVNSARGPLGAPQGLATYFCDDHRPTGTPLTESTYAPAWRRFCALVEGK